MATFIHIILNIILPILVLTATGFILGKTLTIDSKTLAQINLYIFVPALLFTRVYDAEITLSFVANLFVYIIIVMALMYLLGTISSKLLKLPDNTAKVFNNSLIFFNSGNYGIPVIELVFKNNPIASTGQILILLVQNILSYTYGVFQISSGNSGNKAAFKNMLKMPVIYVLVLVVIVKIMHLQMPESIMIPLRYASNGLIPVALVTLGVQLSEFRKGFRLKEIASACFLRLIAAPVIGYALVLLLNVQGILAQSLIIGVAMPSAVNTALIAKQFDNEPEYASQIVFFSTILSTVTLTIVIYLVTGFVQG